MRQIPDHLAHHLTILFVGFNPSIRSSETGHHYASPTNRFWKILHLAGITERKYEPWEDASLLDKGIGFTNIVSRPTREAKEITKEEYSLGRESLKRKVERYRPQLVCFVGKGVYEQYSDRMNIPWGLQSVTTIEGVKEFVAPSSSGLVRMKLDEIVSIYKEINKLVTKR